MKYFALIVTLSLGCASLNPQISDRIVREAEDLSPKVENIDEVRHVASELLLEGGLGELPDIPIPEDASLENYIVLALGRYPAIRREIRKLQILGYQVEQIASLEDPMISILPPTSALVQTAAGEVQGGFGISQKIPFPGKITKRSKIAEQEVLMAFESLADLRVHLANEVAKAYSDYLLASISVVLTKESLEVIGQMHAVVSARYKAGATSQQDLLKVEVESLKLQAKLVDYNQQESTARARLNALMSRSVAAALPTPRPFELTHLDLKLSAALQRAAESNPKLRRVKLQIKRDLEAMKLAELDYLPDFNLGFSYNFIDSGLSPVSNGKDTWSLPIGLSLPIWWNKIRARVRASNAQTLSSIEEYQELRNTLLFGLEDTLNQIDATYRKAYIFQSLILPRANQVLEVSLTNYKTGDLSFSEMMESWRSYLDLSLELNRILAVLENRWADLAQLMGLTGIANYNDGQDEIEFKNIDIKVENQNEVHD